MNPEQVYRLLDVAMQRLGPRYEVLRLGTSYRHPDGSHYSLLRRQLMEAAEAVSTRFIGEITEAPATASRRGPEPLTREALQALFDYGAHDIEAMRVAVAGAAVASTPNSVSNELVAARDAAINELPPRQRDIQRAVRESQATARGAMTVRTMPGLPPGHIFATTEPVPVWSWPRSGGVRPPALEEEVGEGAAKEEKPQEDKSRWDF